MGLLSVNHILSWARTGRRLTVRLCAGAVVLVACVVSLASLAFAATTTTNFPDVPSTQPYFMAIRELAGLGVIGGFSDGTFRPEDQVTRQQFAKMIVGAGGYAVSESDVCPFTDVAVGGPSTLYPDNYVAVCAAHGITTGKNATTFDPTGKITRYQMISMVVRAANDLRPGAIADPPADFAGTWGSDPTHGANANRAEANGLLNGLDLSVDPHGNATRGEVAQMLHNLYGLLHYWSNTPRMVYYYGINTSVAPLDNVKVRQALTLAIDRQAIVNSLRQADMVPATGLVPPSIPGFSVINQGFLKATAQVDQAKALLAAAGFPNGVGLPEIKIKVSDNGAHATIANLIKTQWAAIGVNATVVAMPFAEYWTSLGDPANITIFRTGWAADFNDAYEFYNIFRTNGGDNLAKWSNAAFDQALDASLLATTDDARWTAYAGLEKTLVQDEVPVIPIYWQ